MIFVNCFPKSGTHLIRQILRPLAEPCPLHPEGIISTDSFGWGLVPKPHVALNAFAEHDMDSKYLCCGHVIYTNDLRRAIYPYKAIFLHRHLGDVVLSLHHHIVETKLRYSKKRGTYLSLNHEQQLWLVVQETLNRWKQYVGWMKIPGIFKISYEELRTEPEASCSRLLQYLTGSTDDEMVKSMLKSIQPRKSPTFHRGKVGRWKRELTPAQRVVIEGWCNHDQFILERTPSYANSW